MDDDAYAKHNKPETGALPGVYKHPETSEELIATSFPAADAYVRQGWVWDREAPKVSPTSAQDEANKLLNNKPSEDTDVVPRQDGKK